MKTIRDQFCRVKLCGVVGMICVAGKEKAAIKLEVGNNGSNLI